MNRGEKKKPAIVHNPFDVLTPKEKEWCRATLTDKTYLKMMGIVQKFRPSSSCPVAGSHKRDAFSNERANARLAEMRGWDTYETALFAVLSDAPLPRTHVEEAFPDAGRVDANWGKLPDEPKT
ncbi:MAG: hypothetical protein KGL39_36135 [Patescibacteria group bacterium]|nr:hypothetical protein [Patescibacteria group bacterium]